MSLGKIGAIIISEFVEAILFIMGLLFIGNMPDFAGKDSIITMIISFWVLMGIGTPLIIWFELWDIFKGERRY